MVARASPHMGNGVGGGCFRVECIQFGISRGMIWQIIPGECVLSEQGSGFKDSSRRQFLKGLSATPIAALAAGEGLLAQAGKKPEAAATPAPQRQREAAPFPPPGKKFVAIQIGARSFLDEGV